MSFKRYIKNWNSLAEKHPFESIHTLKKDWSEKDFFIIGEKDVKRIMDFLKNQKISSKNKIALDFGCGVGRLTQPFTKYFKEIYGVDISKKMITLAKNYNSYPKKCFYYLNEKPHLKLFEDNKFDIIFSFITLQHMNPKYMKKYIKEFSRILKPQGVMMIQIPCKVEKKFSIKRPEMEMHKISKKKLLKIFIKNKLKVKEILNSKRERGETTYYLINEK